jgi:hypothetical protein
MIREAISRVGRTRVACAAALAAAAGSLAFAGPATAATAQSTTTTSSNWSGYAAHGSSATFKAVSARWRVPAATCEKDQQSFSAFWVGIGGYDENSTGLEQDGTELDCNANGTESVSAWYELLPAAPHTVSLTVSSGDLMSASVRIAGKSVTLKINDLTTHKSFTKTVRDSDIDDTSAEWIAEAPSDCSSDSDCEVLPLADFGAVRFSNASATTTAGVTSGVETSRSTTTKLLLGYKEEGTDFVASSDSGIATPSALTDGNREFTVAWSGTTTSTGSSGSTGSGSGSTGSGSGSSGGAPNPGGGGFGGSTGGSGGPGGNGGSGGSGNGLRGS